jgi:hypothetical protein
MYLEVVFREIVVKVINSNFGASAVVSGELCRVMGEDLLFLFWQFTSSSTLIRARVVVAAVASSCCIGWKLFEVRFELVRTYCQGRHRICHEPNCHIASVYGLFNGSLVTNWSGSPRSSLVGCHS